MDAAEAVFFFVTFTTCFFHFHAQSTTISPGSNQSKPTITFCIIFEENTNNRVYDYKREAAAFDIAIDYVGSEMLRDFKIEKHYRPLTDVCISKVYSLAQALDLAAQGIRCSAYVGPGGCSTTAQVM